MADNDIDRDFTKLILDIFYNITGLSAYLYYNGEVIYSERHWPKYCQRICEEIDESVCHDFLPETKGIVMCRAGLFCRSIPFKIDDTKVGYLNIGHRRILSSQEKSKKALDELLKSYGKCSQFEKIRYLRYLDEVPAAEDSEFFKYPDNFIENLSLAVPILRGNEVNVKITNKIKSLGEILKIEEEHLSNERRRANEVKSLAANLAHTLLLPIQSIIGYASIINDELDDHSKHKNMVSTMLNEIIKLAFYAESISNCMANDKARFTYKYKEVDLHDLIYDTIKIFRREAETRGIWIARPTIANGTPTKVECSELHIKQVLFNIFHNAVKYSFPGTKQNPRYINTSCSRERDRFKLEIINYGIGITDDEIKKGLIFQEGYRGELSKDSCRTGSGIGLWTIKRIVEDHGGSVGVKSQKMGYSNSLDRADPYLTIVTIELPYRARKEIK